MRIVFASILMSLPGFIQAQQGYTGIVNDNRVNSLMASYNPSSIVDSKSKFSVGVFGNQSAISNFCANDYLVYGTKARYIEHKRPGYKNTFLTLDLLNLKYEFDHKNAGGYSLRVRGFNNFSGLPASWAESAVNEYNESTDTTAQSIVGLKLANTFFTQHSFTYARTIFDRQTSLLKGGITLNILNGLDASYFYANTGTTLFPDSLSPIMTVSDLDANFGSAYTKKQLKYKNRGVGFDLGFSYEYRPDFEEQFYEMDGAKRNVRYDMNKYKWKVTASITDIGRIRYMRDTNYQAFNDPSLNVNASKLGNVTSPLNSLFNNDPYNYIQDSLQSQGNKPGGESDRFHMRMPTALHAGFDMNAVMFGMKNFFVSYNISIPIGSKDNPTKISNFFIHTVTPRLEKSNWSVMLPISQMGNGKFYVGGAGRVTFNTFSIFAGSNNLSLFYGKKSSLSANLFAGISVDIWYKVPDDRDGDKISDPKDACPYDPGLPEYQGCPDTDGDGIIDKEDLCIYDKGPKNTKGCPDTDGDGIIDMNDMCPNEKGLGIHYGCPDRDKDGVIDAADRCPDVPGMELNNGCPIDEMKKNCCVDDDNDGVVNEKDKCPNVPGSVYNSGCPIDSSNIEKVPLQKEKELKDANNTGQQVKDNPQADPRKQLITSQEEMNVMMTGKKVILNHAAYFDVDEATLTAEEQKRLDNFSKTFPKKEKLGFVLIGYTDRDGSLDYNLALSKRRAETIQRKLVDIYGVDIKVIEIYYYGETKSIHKGDYTEELKQADRKVEIKVIRLQ